ncbi:MAG: aminoglycoside phosphotransferase family protein [Alphaproteobacteria bacterium]|nr:aminoglycoside phosphotransferase family protein [Alphaproteobacteria bacterium]
MRARTPLPPDVTAALRRLGLLPVDAPAPSAEALAGGVSSDIWRVALPAGPVCVKRALARLKVAADWRAPVERSQFEARWMAHANRAVPGAAPALLGHDAASGTLVMEYKPPATHPVWKARLHEGWTSESFAAAVGCNLARIQGATAGDAEVAPLFRSETVFEAIRLEPYLRATAARHPDRAAALQALADATAATRRTLVHGDVSPKNILVGPAGPVFLDAECATWGDPAFDLAFCLTHLLLKCLWTPRAAAGFLACYAALAGAYLADVSWEAPAAVAGRAARLLPGLLLARVDGKSPVEYITADADKDRVRRVARALLAAPPARLEQVAAAWREEGLS